jgi:hypothetical protein
MYLKEAGSRIVNNPQKESVASSEKAEVQY